jgi:8-oxo-dGTP diphosphatase
MANEFVMVLPFDEECKDIVVIKKLRPKWQEGKFNCPGGSLEKTDASSGYGAKRELREETGIDPTCSMRFVCTVHWMDSSYVTTAKCHVFSLFSDEIYKAETKEDEQVSIMKVSEFLALSDDQIIPDLRWLIPMAIQGVTAKELYIRKVN